MYYLIYSSYSKKDMGKEDLFSLLEKSRVKNKLMGISGFLLCINADYHPEIINGRFIQVLEGDKKEVKKLFESIKKDPRHKHVEIIADGVLMKRMFDNWSMGYRDLDILKFKSRLDKFELTEDNLLGSKNDDESQTVLDFIKSFYRVPDNIVKN
ncbi:MAG: BLUF domain-containing protein [Cytophagales bacterium]